MRSGNPAGRFTVVKQCPTCGQALVLRRFPQVDLNTNKVFNDKGSVKLGPRQAEIMHILVENHPARQPWDAICHRIYAESDYPKNPATTVSWFMVRLRLHLKHLGWTVKSEVGVGYYLEEMKSATESGHSKQRTTAQSV